MSLQKFTTCLCFNNQAEQAVKFYLSIFKDSKILSIRRYTEDSLKALSHLPEDMRPGPVNNVMVIEFKMFGQKFLAVNGGPYFKFSEGMSIAVNCETQEEIDYLWDKLSEDGEKQECGWIKDKYGVSWQVVPTILSEMVHDKDIGRSERVIKALYKMKKIDIKTLQEAYRQN
jgi:predicted 3-demethylubiquinone-9 3-methyltransferase (glyoxalase superfamily)